MILGLGMGTGIGNMTKMMVYRYDEKNIDFQTREHASIVRRDMFWERGGLYKEEQGIVSGD